MKRPLLLALFLVLPLACTVRVGVEAAVIVFANATDQSLTFALVSSGEKPRAYRIAAGDVLPIPVRDHAIVRFDTGSGMVDRPLAPNSIGTFVRKGQLDLAEQRFGGDAPSAQSRSATSSATAPLDPLGTVPVMILVDEDEPAVRRVWESRLRNRVRDASRIFEHHCRMRLDVVAVDTWKSNDGITDFSLSLREFEREVRLKPPARLAIGFTSQYRKPDKRRVHLGGTRGPLHPYLLVREWSQHISEPERLEVLVHELGHVLGASHSAEPTSVMRPMVGDRQSCARSFRIGFDPVNTLAMYVFCEQLRLGHARRLDDFSPSSRALLATIYREMDRRLPDDTSATRYLALIQHASRQRATASRPPSLATATRSVIRAVTRAARDNRARPLPPGAASGSAARLDGDALAEYYIRAAASEARHLPELVATKAYLLGLAIALEKSSGNEGRPLRDSLYHRYETPRQRRDRLAVLGSPTLHGREDLLRHFTTAAALCATVGASGAESLCTLKEISDSHGSSGFSFADLAADLAGIEVATRLDKSRLSLDELARSFEVRRFLPPPDTLPEDLSREAFKRTYGGTNDPRFRRRSESVRRQILALPGYS